MSQPPLHIIVLAAGKGTRMKSATPKVLHNIAHKPMLGHVLDAANGLSPDSITVVLSPGSDAIEQAVTTFAKGATIALQEQQLGTGHAVAAAMENLPDAEGDVLVVYGDTPLMTSATLNTIIQEKRQAAATIALAGIYLNDPTGYGRLIMPKDPLVERIVEQKDASAEQKEIRWGWGGIMAFSADFLRDGLSRMTPSAATGEYYLTELLEMSSAAGYKNLMVPMSETEAMGVNDRVQLAAAEAALQQRLRETAMRSGVTMTAPETVFLCADTRLDQDVTIEPHVVFGPGVSIASNVHIKAYSHIEGAAIGAGSIIGPFARLRPGSKLAADVKIGNFVEIKKSSLAQGAKVSHLSYIGDSTLGAHVNIGAGTITCNYDGKNKHQTTIKAGAFIGSNSALVAPVVIGENALIGAGSVITDDVPDGALALGRGQQAIKARKEN